MAPARGKRKIEVVDLTSDEAFEAPTPKRTAGTTGVPTPPSSSASAACRHDDRIPCSSATKASPSVAKPSSSAVEPASSPAKPSSSARKATPHSHAENAWQYDPGPRQKSWDEEDLALVATQADDEDFELNGQLFGCMNTKVVGIRYYNGVATMGLSLIHI